jgi:hypothetical protein
MKASLITPDYNGQNYSITSRGELLSQRWVL